MDEGCERTFSSAISPCNKSSHKILALSSPTKHGELSFLQPNELSLPFFPLRSEWLSSSSMCVQCMEQYPSVQSSHYYYHCGALAAWAFLPTTTLFASSTCLMPGEQRFSPSSKKCMHKLALFHSFLGKNCISCWPNIIYESSHEYYSRRKFQMESTCRLV